MSNTGRLGPLTLPRGHAEAPCPAARRQRLRAFSPSRSLCGSVGCGQTRGDAGKRRPPQTEPRETPSRPAVGPPAFSYQFLNTFYLEPVYSER